MEFTKKNFIDTFWNVMEDARGYKFFLKMAVASEMSQKCREELEKFDPVTIPYKQLQQIYILKKYLDVIDQILPQVAQTFNEVNMTNEESFFFTGTTLLILIEEIYACCGVVTTASISESSEENTEKEKEVEHRLQFLQRFFETFVEQAKDAPAKFSAEDLCAEIEDKNIDFCDFVVRTQVFKCNNEHDIEQVQANIDIMQINGHIMNYTVTAGYCNICKCYFILERDYKRIRILGVPLCRQITYEVYQKNGIAIMDGSSLREESLLHQFGYNVSAAENLSSQQRQEILRRIVDNGIYTISGVCSHLDWLIERNRQVWKKDMSLAISKWTADRNYIASYGAESQRKVGVGSITWKKSGNKKW